jgi:hypothetical protein
MKEMIAFGKDEKEVIRAAGEIKYYPSGSEHPHISTLKKWYKIWRERTE